MTISDVLDCLDDAVEKIREILSDGMLNDECGEDSQIMRALLDVEGFARKLDAKHQAEIENVRQMREAKEPQ